jgi:hypothetical protein
VLPIFATAREVEGSLHCRASCAVCVIALCRAETGITAHIGELTRLSREAFRAITGRLRSPSFRCRRTATIRCH